MCWTLSVVALLAAAPERITFEQAVQRALQLNPALRAADADVARAEGQLEQARSGSLPTLGVNGTYTRLDADRTSNGVLLAGANQLSANAQLVVPLVVPNRWATWSRSSASATAVKASSDDVRRQVALSTARTWLLVLAGQRVVQAQQSGVDVSQAHLKYATERRAGGLGNKLDELRAAQELAVAKTQLFGALASLDKLQEQLGVAVGVDVPLDATDAEPALAALPDEPAALEGARSVRLDVVAAQQRVEAATVATRWDFSDYTPLLSAVVQPGYQNPPTSTQPLWNFQAQVLLSIPLFDGGLRYGQERERRAQLTAAQLQLESAVRQASAEVRTALKQVQRADQALVAAQDAAADASAALTLAQQAFAAGGITNLEVVDAERRARDAATAQALAEDTARQARLEALGASGRFP